VPFFTPSRGQRIPPAETSGASLLSSQHLQASPTTQTSLTPPTAGTPEPRRKIFIAEEKRFKIRYENSYDITTDATYTAWRCENHPGSAVVTTKMKAPKTNEVNSLPTFGVPQSTSATRLLVSCSSSSFRFPLLLPPVYETKHCQSGGSPQSVSLLTIRFFYFTDSCKFAFFSLNTTSPDGGDMPS
jgi:hypothetical protein